MGQGNIGLVRMRGRSALSAVLMATAAIGPLATAPAAQAQAAAERSFDIPAQSLSQALVLFATQSGYQVATDGATIQGVQSPGVRGAMTPAHALSRLLAGTGFAFRIDGDVVTLTTAADGAIQLGAVRVEGAGGAADAGDPALAVYRTPGSGAYISEEDIQRFRGTSPADIFKGTPGVISGEARNSGAIDVNIRGLQGYGRTAVTVDGAQQQSSVDRGYFGDANRTFIDPDLLSGVSITKGPSNAPSSSGAIGGTVAMTTLIADDVVKPGNVWGLRLRGGLNGNSASPPPVGTLGGIEDISGNVATSSNIPGVTAEALPTNFGDTPATGRPDWSEPTGWNGSIALATKQQNFEIVGAIAHRENGNYYAGADGDHARIGVGERSRTEFIATQSRIDSYDRRYPGHGVQVGDTLYREVALYGNIGLTDYRAGDEVLNTSFRSWSALIKSKAMIGDENTMELGYSRNESQFGFIWPSAYKFIARPEQTPLSDAVVDTLNAKYQYAPEDNNYVHLALNSWFTRQQFDEVQAYTPAYSTSVTSSEVASDARRGGLDVSNTSKLDGDFGNISVTYGLAYLKEKSKIAIDTSLEAYPQNDRWSHRSGRRDQWDIFSTATWKPTDWLTADIGGRYLSVATEYEATNGYYHQAIPLERVGPIDRRADGFAPNGSVTVSPLRMVQIYAAYREGLRIPSFMENRDVDPASGIARLEPERAHTYEAGFNLILDDMLAVGSELRFKANYFLNDINDYIVMYYLNGTANLTTMNYDQAVFSGVELSGAYNLGAVFGSASAIFYDRVKLCMTEVECYRSGSEAGIPLNDWRNHVPPEIHVSATLGVRVFDEKLTIAGRVNHTSERAGMPEVFWNSTSPRWAAYTTFDVFGSYEFDNDITLEFSGENVTDVYYVDALASAMQPAPGRTLRTGLTASF